MDLGGAGRWRATCEARIKALTKRSEISCTGVELLPTVSRSACDRRGY